MARGRPFDPLERCGGGGFAPCPLDRRCQQLRANSCRCSCWRNTNDEHLLQEAHALLVVVLERIEVPKYTRKRCDARAHEKTQEVSGERAAGTLCKAVREKKSARHPPEGVDGEVKGRVEV